MQCVQEHFTRQLEQNAELLIQVRIINTRPSIIIQEATKKFNRPCQSSPKKKI